MSITGNKAELAAALKVSLPTLSAWMMRYRPDFPIKEAGANGRSYVFDFEAVFTFLRTKKEEQARLHAERDEQLAQLMLPFDILADPATAPARPSVADEIKAWQLRRLQREEAERAGALVRADYVATSLGTVMARLSRDTRAFLQQLGREQNWPPAYLQAVLARHADVQRICVTELQQQFCATEQDDDRRHA